MKARARKTVFVLGNEFFEPDSLAVKVSKSLAKRLKSVRFKLVSDPSELFKKRGRIVVLDVVKGIRKVTVLEDLRHSVVGKRVSAHDFDYGFQAKIMNALGKSPRALVIGIPLGYDEEKAVREVARAIEKLIRRWSKLTKAFKEHCPKLFGDRKCL